MAGDLVRRTACNMAKGQTNLASEISKTLPPINLLVNLGGGWRRGTALGVGGGLDDVQGTVDYAAGGQNLSIPAVFCILCML